MKEIILSILQEINPYEDIDENTSLIKGEILDSLTLVLLINELENKLNIKIPEDKLQPETFESVCKIVELIEDIRGK